MSIVFIAQSDGEVLRFRSNYHENSFKVWLKNIKGKWVRIELAKHPVSDKIRAYYWGAILPTVKDAVGYWSPLSTEKIHEILKREFNGFVAFNPRTKQVEKYARPAMSKESDSLRAMAYIEKIRLWLLEEYHTELPNPDEWIKNVRDNPQIIN